jgi:hypothetical protein
MLLAVLEWGSLTTTWLDWRDKLLRFSPIKRPAATERSEQIQMEF